MASLWASFHTDNLQITAVYYTTRLQKEEDGKEEEERGRRRSAPTVGGVRGAEGDCGSGWGPAHWPQAALWSFFTFRVLQTVGVNAAQTTDATKFPRSTFGCRKGRGSQGREDIRGRQRAQERATQHVSQKRETKKTQRR